MPDIPEIEVNPTTGPLLKMVSPDESKVWDLTLDDDGDICLNGDKFRHVDAQDVGPTQESSTTSDTYVDIPGATLTTAGDGSKIYKVTFDADMELNIAKSRVYIRVVADGTPLAKSERAVTAPAAKKQFTTSTSTLTPALAAGKTIKVQWRVERLAGQTDPAGSIHHGTLTIYGVN
jgi:hypothetical protein